MAPTLYSSAAAMAANCIVLPSDDEAASRPKRRAPIYRRWHLCDELRILTELAAERRKSGALPSVSKLPQALQDKEPLKRANPSAHDLADKVYGLKAKFISAINSGGPGHKPRDQMLYNLSMEVWPQLLQPVLI